MFGVGSIIVSIEEESHLLKTGTSHRLMKPPSLQWANQGGQPMGIHSAEEKIQFTLSFF
jgi:hypothetical protein